MRKKEERNPSVSINSDDSENSILLSNIQTNKKNEENPEIFQEITDIINSSLKQNKKESKKIQIENTATKIINFLNQNNIDLLQILDNSKNTILHYYISKQYYIHIKIILFCINEINKDENLFNSFILQDNSNNLNIFEISSEIGDMKIFKILLPILNDNTYILSELVNPERENNIFHVAAKNNQILSLLFYYHFYNANREILEIKNINSQTALYIACSKNYFEFANILINFDVDINQRNSHGKTALFSAAECSSVKLVKNLILHGADKNIKDRFGHKCIYYIKNDNYKQEAIYDILENKNIFIKIFKCPIIYQNLKNQHKNLLMIFVIFIYILLQIYFLITMKFINNNFNKYIIEFIFIISDLVTELFCYIIYICIHIYNSNKNIKNKNNDLKLYEMYYNNNNNDINVNLCVKCKKYITGKTKHCIVCDKCIDNWDHHCFWLNTCINGKNYDIFIVFLINIFLSLIFNLTSSVYFLIDILFAENVINEIFFFISINENYFVYFKYGLIVLDTIYFLMNFIFMISFIIPFLFCDLMCKKSDNKKIELRNMSIDEGTSMNEKLTSASNVTEDE